jgi:hypothetical protein
VTHLYDEPYPVNSDGTIKTYTHNMVVETLVCPYCGSLNFDEAPTETKGINLADITSLKDVAPNEVDQYINDGYTVYQTWQKNVFVVKLKPKETEQTTPAIQFDHVTKEDEQA